LGRGRGRPIRDLQPLHVLRLGRRAPSPVVATGDFHRPEHLASWKTLLPVEQNEQAVVEYLHSTRPAALTVFDPATESLGRAA